MSTQELTALPNSTMLSIEIVKIINELRENGKAELRHNDFMAKIVKVLGEEAARKFSHSYKGKDGTTRPCYALPKRECHLMVMSESYKVQAAVYDRMTELETSIKVPQTLSEALLLAGRLAAEKEALEEQARLNQHKLQFADVVSKGSNDRCIRIWVKAMKHENNLAVGEREVFKWLVDNHYIYRAKDGYLPYAKYEANNANYFTVSVDEINKKVIRAIKITGKGVVALTGKVVAHFAMQNMMLPLTGYNNETRTIQPQ